MRQSRNNVQDHGCAVLCLEPSCLIRLQIRTFGRMRRVAFMSLNHQLELDGGIPEARSSKGGFGFFSLTPDLLPLSLIYSYTNWCFGFRFSKSDLKGFSDDRPPGFCQSVDDRFVITCLYPAVLAGVSCPRQRIYQQLAPIGYTSDTTWTRAMRVVY